MLRREIMRKVTALVMTMIICISLVVSAAASANFVPSITAKPAPEVVAPPAADTGKAEPVLQMIQLLQNKR